LLFAVTYSSPVPPFPNFVFTLAATGTTEEKAETGKLKAEGMQNSQFKIVPVTGRVEFLGRLEHGFCTQSSPGVVAGEQGLEFADNQREPFGRLCRKSRVLCPVNFRNRREK